MLHLKVQGVSVILSNMQCEEIAKMAVENIHDVEQGFTSREDLATEILEKLSTFIGVDKYDAIGGDSDDEDEEERTISLPTFIRRKFKFGRGKTKHLGRGFYDMTFTDITFDEALHNANEMVVKFQDMIDTLLITNNKITISFKQEIFGCYRRFIWERTDSCACVNMD